MSLHSIFYPLDSVFYFIAADPFWALLIMLSVAFVFATLKETSHATAALAAEVTALVAQVGDAREAETKLRSEVAQAVALVRRLRDLSKHTQEEGQAVAAAAEDTVQNYRDAVDVLVMERDELLTELADLEATSEVLVARQDQLAQAHEALAVQVRDDASNAAAVLQSCFADHEQEALDMMARRDALLDENAELRSALEQMESDTQRLLLESQVLIEQQQQSAPLATTPEEVEEPLAMDPLAVMEELTGECYIRTAASVGPSEERAAVVAAPEETVIRHVLGNATNTQPNGKKKNSNDGKAQKKNAAPNNISNQGKKNGGGHKRRHRKALVKLVGN